MFCVKKNGNASSLSLSLFVAQDECVLMDLFSILLVHLKVGSPRVFGFPIKDHLQLGKDLDLIDFDTAAEVFLLF